MNNTLMIIIGILSVLLVGAFFFVRFYKKKNMNKLFEQLYVTTQQIPKQKKKSFILLMLIETLSNSGKNATFSMTKLSNPKQLEVQLLQMNKLLKNPASVTDKKSKQSLAILKDYLVWEENKKAS